MTLRSRWFPALFRFVAIAGVALVLHACEPLDDDTQGEADDSFDAGDSTVQTERTPQAKPATPPPAAETGDLGSRVDSIADAQRALATKVEGIASDVKDIKSSLSQQQDAAEAASTAEYRRGLDEFYDRKYQEGAETFRHLLASGHPTALQSNCLYWIGECEYGAGNYDAALEAFRRVSEYPSSAKLDDAEMMVGMTYLRLGNRERARQAFEHLIDRYPDSEFVPRARRLLEKL